MRSLLASFTPKKERPKSILEVGEEGEDGKEVLGRRALSFQGAEGNAVPGKMVSKKQRVGLGDEASTTLNKDWHRATFDIMFCMPSERIYEV